MSIDLISAVFKRGPEDRSKYAVLMALADNASDQGICWPKLETIARKSRMTSRNAMNVMKKLEREGWIEIERRAMDNIVRGKKRKGKVNRYQLSLEKLGLGSGSIPEILSRENPSPEKPSRENPSDETVSSESLVQKHQKHGGKTVRKDWKTCA